MSRRNLIRSQVFPYHVIARANNREPFACEPVVAWRILASQCYEISILFGARVYAFVLMENHFHLLLGTPHEDLGVVMKHYMESGTRMLNFSSGREGHAFSGRYRWSIVQDVRYFGIAMKYIYRNPVRAGLCAKAEDYPFSSLHSLLGRSPLPFPMHPGPASSHEGRITEKFLDWINMPFAKEGEMAVRKALQSTQFKPAATHWNEALQRLQNGR